MQPYHPTTGRSLRSPDAPFAHGNSTSAATPEFPLSLVRPGDLVFDVGANLGAKAERFLAAGARVVCVEPQPDCAAQLRRKFANNPNVAIEEKGLAEKTGTRQFSICSAANTISTFSEEWKKGRFADYKWDRVINVQVTTLDELIRQHGVPRYCKIDVEGFELSVLEGLTRRMPCVSFEFTIEFLANARRCVEHLERLGFTRFNVCLGENKHREFPQWLDARQLFAQIATLEMEELWGDIYAESDCVSDAAGSAVSATAPVALGPLELLQQGGVWREGTPLRLHLGCGEQHFPGYVNIDYPPAAHHVMNVKADVFADITQLDFPPGSVDEIRLHHVFEHFSRVTALAMLIRWHGWLKVGGKLRIETPDILGGARTLCSNATLKVKMGVARHIAGDQADSWAYHVDHWWPERYEHTLKSLGYDVFEIRSSSWAQEPFLSNVETIALKRAEVSCATQLTAADNLLWESTVSPAEKPTWEVWRKQLRDVLARRETTGPANTTPTLTAPAPVPPPTPPPAPSALAAVRAALATHSSPLPLEAIHDFNQLSRDAWMRQQAAEIPAGSRVLDVGAGTCPYRQFFGHCEYRTHDFKKFEGVKLGNTTAYGAIDFVSDIAAIPAPDASFDVVVCTEVLEHVPEPIAALRELARLVRPGGRLLITAPLMSGLHQLPFHFYSGYTPEWYKHFGAKFGLGVTSLTPNGGAFRLLAQETARVAWTWDQHGHLHGENAGFIRELFNELLPRFLYGLEDKCFNDQLTAGYFVAYRKLPVAKPVNETTNDSGAATLPRAKSAPAEKHRRAVTALVFSKDRPLQLDATLRSFAMHRGDAPDVTVKVLFTTSTPELATAYEQVQREHRGVELIRETNFRADVLRLVAAAEQILFLVDDTLFVRPFRLDAFANALAENPAALGVSLRLGRNTTNCYSLNCAQALPAFTAASPDLLEFSWPAAACDFSYPLEVSSSLYRVAEVLPVLQTLAFTNPNTLEARLSEQAPKFAATHPRLLCPPASVAFSVPANKVQTSFDNRAARDSELSATALAARFANGERIAIGEFNGFTPNGCHQEVPLKTVTIGAAVPVPPALCDDELELRSRLGEALHHPGPLPVEEFLAARRIFEEMLQAQDLMVFVHAAPERLTPAFFALFAENILEVRRAGNTALAEQLESFKQGIAARLTPKTKTASATKAAPQSPPTVSVIVPCYRQADLLPETVASVLAQTFTDWELLIVNDGSPDNTSAVARELIAKNPDRRIRLLEKPNGGLSDARNAGMRAARGRYLVPLDSDDLLQPAFLSKTVAALDADPKISIAYTDVEQFGHRNELWLTHDGDPRAVLANTRHAYCALFRREVWESVGGYNRNMVWGYEDWDFWVGCFARGFQGRRLAEPLLRYRTKAESMITKAREHDLELKAQIVLNHPQLYTPTTREGAEKILADARRQREATAATPAPTAPPASTPANDLAAMLNAANAAFQRGDLASTRDALSRAAELSPQDGDIRESLGCVFFQLGEVRLAHLEFSKANRLRPDRAETLVKLAMAAVRLDHIEEFEAALGRALELEPNHREGLKLLGDLNIDAGHYSHAAQAFLQILETHPADMDSLLSLGLCCYKVGDQPAAQSCYERALAIDPNNALAKENLAALGVPTDTAAGAVPQVSKPANRPTVPTPQTNRTRAGLETGDTAGLETCATGGGAGCPPSFSSPPRISVILPTYNRPQILAQCLAGFAAQTLPKEQFEIVIVDDGSQPPVEDVAKHFAAQLRLTYHYQPNCGLAAARNQCIELARAPWLALHDDDDVPAADYLERCVAFHQAHPAETDILLAQVAPAPALARTPLLEWMFDGRNGVIGFPAPGVWHGFDKFYGGTSSCKRSLFAHAQYDPEYRFGYEDMELALRLSRTLALRVEYHPEVVSQLVRGPEFAGMFRRSYREGRSLRRCFEQHGEAAFTILSPEFRQCGELVSKMEPKLAGLLDLVRKLEQPSVGGNVTLTVDGRVLTGREALLAAYSFCVRHARARGWLDFANRLAEADGLARIDFTLTPYRGAAERSVAPVTMVTNIPAPVAATAVSTHVGNGKTALAYFHSNLYPPRSGAHRRCLSLLQGLRALGYDVTLVSCNLFTDQPWNDESVIGLEREQGIHARIYYATAADREYVAQTQARSGLWGMHTPPGLVNFFRQLGRELSPAVVLVNYAYCAELADGPEFAAATRVVEMHDLVSLSGPMAGLAWGQLGQPPYALKSAPPAFLEEKFFAKQGLTVDPEEFRRYGRFDVVTAISNTEAAQVQQKLPGAQVAWLPMAHNVPAVANTYSGPPVFVIFTNPFNLQGYLYFIERVLPKVRRAIPGFTLRVIGDACKVIKPVPGVELLGFVPELQGVYAQARFALCPLIGGTGQQVKIVEAMAHGLPVVSLSNVAASSPIENGVNGFIADTAEQFADAVIRLHQDSALCRKLGQAAREKIAAENSTNALARRLGDAIATAVNRRATVAATATIAVPLATTTSATSAATSTPAPALQRPVRWLAPFFNPSGYASEAINFVLPLSERTRVGILHHTRVTSEKFVAGLAANERQRLFELRDRFDSIRGGIVVCHNVAPGFARVADGEFHIGRTMFETDRLPLEWVTQCNQMDEVWVPSRFNLESFAASGVERRKLRVMPEAVDAAVFDPAKHTPLPLPHRAACNFLAIFEWSRRKAWDVLLAAYLREFTASDDVCLYLRTYLMSQPDGDPTAAIQQLIREHAATLGLGDKALPRIEILAEQVATADLPRLYLAADCLVAPSRGEGWGRPQHEAMMMGRPVIATNFSGTTEFMTAQTAYLLDYELAEVKDVDPEHWHYFGHRWANPSEAHLRQLLRRVQQHPEEARAKGAAARAHVVKHFSREPVAELVAARLAEIERQLSTSSLPTATPMTLLVEQEFAERKPQTLCVDWEGSFLDYGSLSHVNREFTRQLARQPRLQVNCVNTAATASTADVAVPTGLEEVARRLRAKPSPKVQITVRHAWPPDWTRPAQGAWVAMQPWEFGVLPDEWAARAAEADELWVYSEYVRRVYVDSGVDPAKVKIVPLGIDPARFQPGATPMKLVTAKAFKFLFVGGTIGRKGADVLLEAYLRGFTAADDVCLVIKDFGGRSVYTGQTLEAQIRAAQARPNAPEILYLTDELAPEALPGLYTACQCLVHPYRGEGFGLPVLEAMACGLPVVVTGGGSTDDFADDTHAYRISATRRSLGDKVGEMKLVYAGWLLEPSATELATRLRWIAANRAEAAAKGRAAGEYARREWTWERSARVASQRLQNLAARVQAEMETVRARRARRGKPLVLPATARLGHLGAATEALRKNQLAPAWNAATAAVTARPFHPEGWLLLAEIAQLAWQPEVARQCVEHARALTPQWKKVSQFAKGNHAKGRARVELSPLPEALTGGLAEPRLTVCVIARNEEKFLPKCLGAVRGLARQIVVVDTGSTDRTVAIAREHGAEVHSFAWTEDFSAARNAALEHARGEWILFLDADEELTPQGRETLLAEMRAANVMAYRFPMIDVGREHEGRSFVPRLFRNAPGLFYVGLVHEQVFSSVVVRCEEWGTTVELGKTELLHYGYSLEMVRSRNKMARNLRLLLRAMEELPNEPNLIMNLGLELVRAGHLARGLEQYYEAFALMSELPPQSVPPELCEALLTQMATRLTGAKRFAEVTGLLRSPLAKARGLTASLHFFLGLALQEQGQFDEAAREYRECVAKRGRVALTPIHPDILGSGPEHCLANCLLRLERKDEARAAFAGAVRQANPGRAVRWEYARFLAEQGDFVEALNLLHALVAERPEDAAAWNLGGQIALRRPEFLEFALDWTGEALRALPTNPALVAQRAEALMFNGELEAALPLWRQLQGHGEHAQRAALVLCEVLTGDRQTRLGAGDEAAVSGEFLQLFRRLVDRGAEALVRRLHTHLGAVGEVLPSAAGVLGEVLAQAA